MKIGNQGGKAGIFGIFLFLPRITRIKIVRIEDFHRLKKGGHSTLRLAVPLRQKSTKEIIQTLILKNARYL